jgi:hypothetical protein
MAIENEVDQVMGRFPGGALAPTGSFWNVRTGAVFQQTSDGTLPALDWWHFIPTATAGNESMSSCATKINTALNALSPIAGNYAFTSSNLHSYNSGTDLPQSKGTGVSDG